MGDNQTIDDLIAGFNNGTSKRSKPTPPERRRGANKARAQAKKPSKDLPSIVQEGTMTWEIAEALKKGISTHEIAEKYGISDERVKALMTQALQNITDDTSHIFLNYIYMTLARYELILKSLFNNLEHGNGMTNLDVEERIRRVLEDQRRTLEFIMPKDGGGSAFNAGQNFTPTVMSSSKLYAEGNEAIVEQQKLDGGKPNREIEISSLDGVFNGYGIPTRTEKSES